MGIQAVNHRTASQETLVKLCHNAFSAVLNDPDSGWKAVKSPDHMARKYGPGVTCRVAATQEYV